MDPVEELDESLEGGIAIGYYKAADEARVAYEMGAIEEWLDFQILRTHEEWTAWEFENGPIEVYRRRWLRT